MIKFMEKVIFGLNLTNLYVRLGAHINKVTIFGKGCPSLEESNHCKKIQTLDHARIGARRSIQEMYSRSFGDSVTYLLHSYDKDFN